MKSTKLSFLVEYPIFIKKVNNIKKIVFFFPHYHFGGAERVHADIIKIFKEFDVTVIINEKSNNEFLKNEFFENCNFIENSSIKSFKYPIYIKKLAKKINSLDNPIVFGCNSSFFYEIIFLLKPHVKIIDLVHAFSYENINASEKISLPSASRINKRVVLGKKTYHDYANLYAQNNIDPSYLNNITIIKNKVDTPPNYPIKPKNKALNVLFVGRNSYEKRPELFFEIAKQSLVQKLNIQFTVIGDFEPNNNYPNNVKIIGSIKDKQILNQQYTQADVLLITSSREGFPMVVIESMAYGVVPICTNVGEISDFINPQNGNGFIINDNSIEQWFLKDNNFEEFEKWKLNALYTTSDQEKETISYFINKLQELQTNRNLLATYSLNAYNTVKETFSAQKNKEAYLNLFLK